MSCPHSVRIAVMCGPDGWEQECANAFFDISEEDKMRIENEAREKEEEERRQKQEEEAARQAEEAAKEAEKARKVSHAICSEADKCWDPSFTLSLRKSPTPSPRPC